MADNKYKHMKQTALGVPHCGPYTIFTFTFSLSISTDFIMKSTPIVAPCPGGKRP